MGRKKKILLVFGWLFAIFAGSKEYSIGFFEITIFSIIKYFDSTTYYLVSLWRIFKMYFLPFVLPQ